MNVLLTSCPVMCLIVPVQDASGRKRPVWRQLLQYCSEHGTPEDMEGAQQAAAAAYQATAVAEQTPATDGADGQSEQAMAAAVAVLAAAADQPE